MKRKIKDFITKILEYCHLHDKLVYNVIIYSSMIIAAIILGILGFKYYEPEKITNADIEYCKEMSNQLINSNFKDSFKLIKKMEEKGYIVEVNDQDLEDKINITVRNKGDIIFSNLTDDDISVEVSYSNAKKEQKIIAISSAISGIIVGPLVLFAILVIILGICEITLKVMKLKEKFKHR